MDKITLLEIGIGTMISDAHSSMQGYALEGYEPGGSLRAWRDFFVNGRIIGVDIQPDTQFNEDRIETYLCNSTKTDEVRGFISKLTSTDSKGKKFDIIIDDGSHYDMDQFQTLCDFYPHLKDGGFYIIEDIFPGSKVSEYPTIVASMCNNDPFFYVGVKNNLCIIYKQKINSKRIGYKLL